MNPTHIFVGSANPVKINAVVMAASEQWPKVNVKGIEVESGVSPQPTSNQETKTGAINRAIKVFKLGQQKISDDPILGIGLEGGVFVDENKEMWTTVWAAVTADGQKTYCANGARFKVESIVADKILQGQEMGPVVSKFYNGRSVKTQEGLIGVVTNKFVDRTEEYCGVAKLALGIWYGRDWQQHLPSKSANN